MSEICAATLLAFPDRVAELWTLLDRVVSLAGVAIAYGDPDLFGRVIATLGDV